MEKAVFYQAKKKAAKQWVVFANGKEMVEDMPWFATKKAAVAFVKKYYIRYEIENRFLEKY
jgi:hypothetical protein